jgi:hypothetical protein
MKFENLRQLATTIGTALRDEEYAKIAAAIDGDEETELEGYRLDAYGMAALQVDGVLAMVEYTHRPVAGAREKAAAGWLKKYEEFGLNVDSLSPWEFDEEVVQTAIYGGYASEQDARDDVRRLLLARTLDSSQLRAAAGWDLDVVMLVKGYDFFTLRTHATGQIEVEVNEAPLSAYATYGEAVRGLASEIEDAFDDAFDEQVFPRSVNGALMRKIAHAWLHREAASAMLDQARHSLRVAMEGADRIGQADKSAEINLAELARNLHTDRANLYKLMPSRQPQRRRR